MWRHTREKRCELEVSTAWKDATSPRNDPLPPFVSAPLQYRRRRRRRRRPVNWSRVRGCRAAGEAGVRHPRAVASQASSASNTICNIDGRPAPERCETTLWSSGDCIETCLWCLGLSAHHGGFFSRQHLRTKSFIPAFHFSTVQLLVIWFVYRPCIYRI